MLRARTTALLAAFAALALPSVALAQSAGDDQYTDPLAGSTHSTTHHSSAPSTGSGTSSGTSGSTSPAASTPSSSSSPSASSQAAAGGSTRQLPRTGFELLIPIELGLAMLLAGVTLRRVVTLRERRR